MFTAPDVSADQLCFSLAGDIWLAPRAGGDAHRLTSSDGSEDLCRFSPDGRRVAYSATRDNNTDVYVVSTSGGAPTRVTWYTGPDVIIDWTDDRAVFFAKLRGGEAASGLPFRYFTQPVNEAVATAVDLPGGGVEASWSPDHSQLAYMPYLPANDIWKRYRGGRTTPVWIVNMADAEVTKVARQNSNDRAPMWVGDTIFFLSDRNGPTTLHGYDVNSGSVRMRITNTGLDIKSAQAGPGAIAYEQFGSIHLYDVASGQTAAIELRPIGELTAALPRWVKVGSQLSNADLSPSGARAVFEGRGEIITVPAEKGDARNISNTAKPDSTKSAATGDTAAVVIDFAAIDQRTIALSVAPANYVSLMVGKPGVVYLAEAPLVPIVLQDGDGPGTTLRKFELKERKSSEVIAGLTAITVSQDGGKLLYRKGEAWGHTPGT